MEKQEKLDLLLASRREELKELSERRSKCAGERSRLLCGSGQEEQSLDPEGRQSLLESLSKDEAKLKSRSDEVLDEVSRLLDEGASL